MMALRAPAQGDDPLSEQGPGTVPEDIAEEAIRRWGVHGPTESIILEGATTVADLFSLQPSTANALFRGDPPTDPVYVVFVQGTYQQDTPGGLFEGKTGMVMIDKAGTVRVSIFWRTEATPTIDDTTAALSSAFDSFSPGFETGYSLPSNEPVSEEDTP
jgi:hypothetical protein